MVAMKNNQKLPRIDALTNADNELALVSDDTSLKSLTAVSYRRRDGQLIGHGPEGIRRLGHLAKPMIGQIQSASGVLLVIDQPGDQPFEASLTLHRHP